MLSNFAKAKHCKKLGRNAKGANGCCGFIKEQVSSRRILLTSIQPVTMTHDFTTHSTKSLIELGAFLKQGIEFTPLLKEPKQDTINQIKQELKRRRHERNN